MIIIIKIFEVEGREYIQLYEYLNLNIWAIYINVFM